MSQREMEEVVTSYSQQIGCSGDGSWCLTTYVANQLVNKRLKSNKMNQG